jgi:hypothetical protein
VCAAREIWDETPRGSMLRIDCRKELKILNELDQNVILATILFYLHGASKLIGSKTSSRSAYR